MPSDTDSSCCPARQSIHNPCTTTLWCAMLLNWLKRLVLPADCYDGDVMGRLALQACKQMNSFTRVQNLSSLVSTCHTLTRL